MVEPTESGGSTPQPDPILQQLETLRARLETLTESLIQDVSAIQTAVDCLLHGFQRDQSFADEDLRPSLTLITSVCRQAAERIEGARRQFPAL